MLRSLLSRHPIRAALLWSFAELACSSPDSDATGASSTTDSEMPSDNPAATHTLLDGGSPLGDGTATHTEIGAASDAGDEQGSDETTSVPSPIATSEETDIVIEIGDEPAPDCERQISFSAVTLSDPPAFDVVIVADHSDSLSWSREDLSKGLSTLLQDLAGRDLRFFVLTPTQYGASSAAVDYIDGSDLVPWRDPVTGVAYDHEMTSYTQECKDPQGTPIECPEYEALGQNEFSLTGKFTFRMPSPVAQITKDMSDAEVTVQQTAVQDAILGLGSGGSPYEQPLCTLNRYVMQDPALLPERVVFIVLSDEDDSSAPYDCMDSVDYSQSRGETVTPGCTAGCDYVQYVASVPSPAKLIEYTCVPVDDLGVESPENAKQGSFPENVDVCDSTAPSECTDADLKWLDFYCDPTDKVSNCQATCTTGGVSAQCVLNFEGDNHDACDNAFELDGTSYSNLADYCNKTQGAKDWQDCQPTGYIRLGKSEYASGSESARPVVGALDAAGMAQFFTQQAAAVFGENYSVETIVMDPSFSCELQAGQSYATVLRTIASSDADVFPICESYAPALQRVRGYAETLLQNEYTFSLGEKETISAVRVTDVDGTERTLTADQYDYDFDASKLTLHPGSINGRDRKLNVELEIHCTAVVR
jgi:hypothetical protein